MFVNVINIRLLQQILDTFRTPQRVPNFGRAHLIGYPFSHNVYVTLRNTNVPVLIVRMQGSLYFALLTSIHIISYTIPYPVSQNPAPNETKFW
jgi:hypothetical protein